VYRRGHPAPASQWSDRRYDGAKCG
jgi:hypothetical protein